MAKHTATKRGFEDTDDGYNAPASPGGGSQPPSKRRRTETEEDSDKRDTRQAPNHPCDSLGCLPKDILNMILSLLEPLDLLRVSCLQRKFRQIVQENPSLWEQARENFVAANAFFETLPSFKFIIEKLCALGWQNELVGSTKSKLCRLPIVRESEILTEGAWVGIEPEVLAFMEKRRAVRVDVTTKRLKKFFAMHKEAAATLPTSTARLNAIDIASAWTFSGLIFDTDIEKEVEWPSAEVFNHVVASANEAMIGMMQDELLNLMDQGGLSRDRMRRREEQLESVRFHCTSCKEGLAYPAVLTHSCGVHRYQRARVVKDGEDDVIEYSLKKKCRWRVDDLIAVAPSPRRRKLLARVEVAEEAMYVCKTCHEDSKNNNPFWNEGRLGVPLNRQEAAAHKHHDDWWLVKDQSSIAFAQKRIEVEKQQMGRDFDRTIHGVKYERKDEEVWNLRAAR